MIRPLTRAVPVALPSLVLFLVLAVAVPAGSAARPGERIDRYLSAIEAFGFSGAIAVVHEGEVVLRAGYGLADRETRRPYTPDTVQTQGSVTKQMTGAAILVLDARGELSVDDTLAQHFDDVPEDKRGITLRELLTHSSGMVGGIGSDEEPIDASTYVERAMAEPLRFEPGTGYGYSNAGYTLLGIVVQRVSGRDYEHFLREELLLPAGMEDTGYVLPAWDPDRLAVGYRNGERWGLVHGRGWRDDGPGWHLRANGGLHTTVDDMARWLGTLRGEGVLDVATARRWTTGTVDEGSGDSFYAYGWVESTSPWGRTISHDGGNGIFSAVAAWLPEREFFVYLHGNSSMKPAYREDENVLAAAFDPDFAMPPLVAADEDARPESARAREGTYRLGRGSVELMADDTRLIAKLRGQSTLDLLLRPTDAQRVRFTDLNRRVQDAMDGLRAGDPAALAGMVGADEDPAPPTRRLLDRIEQIGGLQELHVIGTFANAPGSALAPYGPWTTFVYAEFENWNQYWNLVWNEDGTYRGNAQGPWPSFTLVPTGEATYRAVQQETPWHAVDARFEDGCLVIGSDRACPVDGPAEGP